MDSPIYPTSGIHIIETCDDNREFAEKLERIFLDWVSAKGDFDSWASIHHKFGSHFSLVGTNIFLTEKELSVQVG